MDGAAGHDDRRRRARVPHAHAALELLRPRQDAQRRRLGRCPDAAGRAADDRADRPRDRACERLPPGRHLALRAPGGRRADHGRLGRLRHAGAPGCDRRRRDHAGRRLGRRREPRRRPLASRRRLRHRRRRRQRVGSRERLACQRRDLDRLVRSAHRLAVSAGAALGSGAALPVCSGARRRHPPRRRRRRRCERRGRGRHSVHGLDRPHAARGRRDRARLGHLRHATSHRARLLRCRERHRLDRHPRRRRCARCLTAWRGPRHRAAGSGAVVRSPHALVERRRRCRQSHRREHELRGARHDSPSIRQAGARIRLDAGRR